MIILYHYILFCSNLLHLLLVDYIALLYNLHCILLVVILLLTLHHFTIASSTQKLDVYKVTLTQLSLCQRVLLIYRGYVTEDRFTVLVIMLSFPLLGHCKGFEVIVIDLS